MGVNLNVANIMWPVGAASFFTSFFSTIVALLEPAGWGTRFPVLMDELYQGELSGDRAAEARKELDTIQHELRAYPPSAVVWDIYDRSKRPPWGDDIADDITDLGNYFVTSDGRDLIRVLGEALEFAAESGYALTVR
jgi:Immunity protein 70